jgi:hypothetical protein
MQARILPSLPVSSGFSFPKVGMAHPTIFKLWLRNSSRAFIAAVA